MNPRPILAALLLAAASAVTACASDNDRSEGQSRLGDSGGGFSLPFFGDDDDNEDANSDTALGGAQIGVNSFLWRASLDTLNFMPLASEDPYGGVIITDWYADPARPNERFKAQVYILDTRLRADALNVSIFRQTLTNGAWVDAAVDPATASQIENAILTKARQLRLSTLATN